MKCKCVAVFNKVKVGREGNGWAKQRTLEYLSTKANKKKGSVNVTNFLFINFKTLLLSEQPQRFSILLNIL